MVLGYLADIIQKSRHRLPGNLPIGSPASHRRACFQRVGQYLIRCHGVDEALAIGPNTDGDRQRRPIPYLALSEARGALLGTLGPLSFLSLFCARQPKPAPARLQWCRVRVVEVDR